ncbi:hypothetical protein, unknown function [Leishmania mexicana MHOM/GT/2001/U1103]|uniref:Uncharacterized protein n=1 Tax=Leishmania mexicana (strain MHOM/GT/2001/U1103) TaxID=929439 RepID=E9ANW1_LEIMU|nr:hypothetical protein, unknown function [Leishmania mexicana MHOM/GT/2001/U1103]CBZ24625.1 hypothetical protein, unknown function [Leishmania mexicana MHOM/GT/2001/U1103]
MPRPSPFLPSDIVAPPATAAEASAAASPPTSTSLSTSQGAVFGRACGDADECSSRRSSISTPLTSTSDAQQWMRGNPIVAPLPGPATEQLNFAESHAFAIAVPSETKAGKSRNTPSTLHPRGRRGHAHGDAAGASTPRKAISINDVKSSRSTGCGGGRSTRPEALQALRQVPGTRCTASLTPLRTTSSPATPSTAAGVSESKDANHRPARRSRINKKAAEAGALRRGRRLPCAAAPTSSTADTSTPALCRRQNMIPSMMPSAHHRQRRRLSSPASSAPSLTTQHASAVNQHEVKTGATSVRARAALTTPTTTALPASERLCSPAADRREVAEAQRGGAGGMSEVFTDIASAAAGAGEKDLQRACVEGRSSSSAEDDDAGRGGSACTRSPAASVNPSGAAIAPTTHQLRFLHECRVSSNNASTASSAPPASPTWLHTPPLPMNFSSRCHHGAHRYVDENRVALTRAGGANDVQSPSSPLTPTVFCVFALPHHRHHCQVQQASSLRSADDSSMPWRESRCDFSRVEQVSPITAGEMQEPCVTDHRISRPPAFLATVARASSSAATDQLSAEGVDAAWWIGSTMGTSPPTPLHASFDVFAQSSAAVSPLSAFSAAQTAPRPAAAPRSTTDRPMVSVRPRNETSTHGKSRFPPALERQVRAAAAAPIARFGDDEYCLGPQPEHATPHISAAKFSSIDPPRASDAPPSVEKARAASGHPSTSLELEGNDRAVIRAAAVAAEAEGGAPQPASSSSLKPQSVIPMIAAAAAASVSQLSHTPAIMLTTPLVGFSSRSPAPVVNSCASPIPPQWHPHHPMPPLHQLSAGSTPSVYGDTGSGGGVVGGVGSNITASTTRSPLPERPRLRTPPHQTACMPATRISGEGHRADSSSRMSIIGGGGGVPPPHQSVPFLLSHSAWKSGGRKRPKSPSPSRSPSAQCSGGIDGTEGDSAEGVAGAVGKHQHQPPPCCLTAFKGLVSDSHTPVGFGSVTTDSDGATPQATSVSPPPQRQHLKSHSGDIFATTTTAARPPMTALGPVMRPRPRQRTSSNGSDTATSTPSPLPMAIASPDMAPTLGTFSASSTFTGFDPAPSCILAAGPRSASISGKVYVHSLTTSPPPRHRSVGSASSLSSMGAFAFNDASTVPVMHNGVLSRVVAYVPLSTASSNPRNRIGGRVGGGAENGADDVVHGDEDEDYLEDGGAGTCKTPQGGNGRRWRVTSSGCGVGAHCCGKPVRLKPGTAIETAIQPGPYARHLSWVPFCAGGGGGGGGGGASAGFSRAGVTNTAAAAAQVGDDRRWSGSEDLVTWLSCAASFTASSTSASTTYASSSFGTVPCDDEHVRHWSSQQHSTSDSGDDSLLDSSAEAEESEDGLAVCTLYAAAPRHYHYRRTVHPPASCDAVLQRRREKRHHRYVRVHHPRRQHRSLSSSPATGRDAVKGAEQAQAERPLPTFTMDVNGTAARPILHVDPAADENVNAGAHNGPCHRPVVTALPGTFVPYSPHLSTSSLLYYDDVCSDDVDDVYYQIEKRLFPVADEAGQSLCRAFRSSPPPPPQTPAAAASASPTGDTRETPHDGSDEPSIDALFTVLNVPLRLNLRGGFHLSDYYTPCPVCHPAMRTVADDTASGLDATASSCSCSCCSCLCSSVCFRSTKRSTLSSRAMSRMSGGTSLGSTQCIFCSDASAKASAPGFAKGLRQMTPPPPPPAPAVLAVRQPGVPSAAKATQPYGVGTATSVSDTLSSLLLQHGDVTRRCDAGRRERKAAAARTAGSHRATAAGGLAPSTFTARSARPYASGATDNPLLLPKWMQGFPPAPATQRPTKSAAVLAPATGNDIEDKVRGRKDGSRGTRGSGDPGRLPPPLVVTAAHRHSSYRRQRVRHPPAAVTAHRRQARYRGGGVGDGALRSQYNRFMRQRLLCVRVNDKITYIDPKVATCAARLLVGAALLAEKTKEEVERERRHRVAAVDGDASGAAAAVDARGAPTETSSAPPASQQPHQTAAYRRHSRCRNGHRHQCHHTHGERRCRGRDQRLLPVERQQQSSTFSHTEAAPGARGSNKRVVPADDGG